MGVGILSCPKIAAEVSFQKELGVLAWKARHFGSASSMLRTILVQVFNCFRPIFRSIKPQFSSATEANSSAGVGEPGEEPGGKPGVLWIDPVGSRAWSWSSASAQGPAEPVACTLEVRLSVFW